MRKPWQAITVASAFAAAVLAVSTLYAETAQDKRGPMMGRGGMMGGMGQMMDHCSQMMGGGSTRPNEQWRKPNQPDKGTPEKKG
jgi:Spy/CpxP family protein refolding chaperone